MSIDNTWFVKLGMERGMGIYIFVSSPSSYSSSSPYSSY